MRRPLALLAGSLLALPALAAQSGPHVHTDRTDARALPPTDEAGVFHFVVYGDRTGGPAEGVEVLRQAVHDTNLLDPDLVMTVGDLIQGYDTTGPWLEQMREYRGIMSELSMPWFPVAGNHDIYWRGPGETPRLQHETNYETHFGPLWYWFEHKDCAFVVLFSDEGDRETGRRGYRDAAVNRFSPEQLGWLRGQLPAIAEKTHAFVFLHHPKWQERYTGANWDDVHAMLVEAGNCRAVFAGHIHRMTYAGVRDGIEYLTLATVGGGLSGDVPGMGLLHHMNQVTVRDDGIEIATIPVGQVLDPRQMTDEFLADANRARGIRPVLRSDPLALDPSGSADGVLVVEVVNPCQREVEVTASLEVNGGGWFFLPDHRHQVVAPGAKATFSFRTLRASVGLERFRQPAVTVQVDYLAPGARIALDPRRVDLPLDFSGIDLAEAASSDGVDRIAHLDGRSHVEVAAEHLDQLPDGPLTVEAWMRADELSGRIGLVSKAEGSEFGIFVNDGIARFALHLDGRYVEPIDPEASLTVGRWHHVAGVFDGDELRLYVDGELVDREPGSGTRTRNAFPLILGGDTGRRGANSLFAGDLDEVRVSTTARYAGDRFVPDRSLAADAQTWLHFDFDRAVGPFHLDGSGAGRHGRARGKVVLVPEDATGRR